MIKVTFYVRGNDYIGFDFNGHSDYSQEGTDIVCSAVSSVAYYVVNTVTDFYNLSADVTVDDGHMHFMTEHNVDITSPLIDGLYHHLLQLQEQYDKDIKVKISEV